jgi:hypothetical protein
LFFLLLPFLHFVWLEREKLLNLKRVNLVHIQTGLIASVPFLYLVLREFFWPPSNSWINYQKPTAKGTILGAQLFVPVASAVLFYLFWRKNKTRSNKNFVIFWFGVGITALGSFPYFAAGLLKEYLSLIAIRADWGSRHQLLMPLGLALSVVGLNELFNWRKKNFVFVATIALSVTLNMFWGSQYFLMSHKQEQLVELFATTKNKIEIATVEDQAMQFNGRGALFRDYEWSGFMTLAEISTDLPGCEELPSGTALTLKSNTPYLKALVTRDLGLYFEVKPCSEVLAENG